jgi:hypothetical protein
VSVKEFFVNVTGRSLAVVSGAVRGAMFCLDFPNTAYPFGGVVVKTVFVSPFAKGEGPAGEPGVQLRPCFFLTGGRMIGYVNVLNSLARHLLGCGTCLSR